jgi:hypothetical protein
LELQQQEKRARRDEAKKLVISHVKEKGGVKYYVTKDVIFPQANVLSQFKEQVDQPILGETGSPPKDKLLGDMLAGSLDEEGFIQSEIVIKE